MLAQTSVSLSTLSISDFSPHQGAAGASVTITGAGFSTTPASNVVQFNGTTAAVSSGDGHPARRDSSGRSDHRYHFGYGELIRRDQLADVHGVEW